MRNYKAYSLIIFISLFWVLPSYAQSAAITNGLTWLSGNQNSNGSWGTKTELILIDTTEAINAFKYVNNTGTDYTEGMNWLSLQNTISTDELSRKIISLANAGVDTSALINILIGYRNADGGWGFYPSAGSGQASGDDSNVYMTAMVLNTLLQYKNSYNLQASINNAISYLLSK